MSLILDRLLTSSKTGKTRTRKNDTFSSEQMHVWVK